MKGKKYDQVSLQLNCQVSFFSVKEMYVDVVTFWKWMSHSATKRTILVAKIKLISEMVLSGNILSFEQKP